jgi:hypothetical protein
MFLQFAVPGAWVPLCSLWMERGLHFAPVELASVCAAQALAAILAPLVAGQIADRWVSPERCVAVCALVAGVLLWLLADLTTPVAVFWTSLAFWLALTPGLTLGTAFSFAQLADPGRDFGRVRLWGTVGWVMPGWLFGYWLSDPGWLGDGLAWLRPDQPGSQLADAARLAGLLAFALSCYALTLPRSPRPQPASTWLAPLAAIRLLRDRSFAVCCAGSFGVCLTMSFCSQAVPLLLAHLGIARAWLPPTLTLAQGGEVVMLALLPMLFLRLGTRGTMLMGLGCWTLGLAVWSVGRPLWLVVGALAAWGVCVCCYLVAGQVFVNSRARGDVRASAQGLLTLVNGTGMLAGHLLVGWVRQWTRGDFGATFRLAAGVATIFTLIFLVGFGGHEPARAVADSDLATGSAPPSADASESAAFLHR